MLRRPYGTGPKSLCTICNEMKAKANFAAHVRKCKGSREAREDPPAQAPQPTTPSRTTMLRRADRTGQKTVCELCNQEKSLVNIARHKKNCNGRVKPPPPEDRQASKARYNTRHRAKPETQPKDNVKRAEPEYNNMRSVQEHLWAVLDGTSPHFPPCPRLFVDVMDSQSWILPIATYPPLFVGVIRAISTLPSDATRMHTWVRDVASECHPDACFAKIPLPHSRSRQAEWIAAMHVVSQRLNDIAVDNDRLEQARKDTVMAFGVFHIYLTQFEAWEAQCAEIRKDRQLMDGIEKYENSLERSKDYAHCRTLAEFVEVWMRFYHEKHQKSRGERQETDDVKPEVVYISDSDETSSENEE